MNTPPSRLPNDPNVPTVHDLLALQTRMSEYLLQPDADARTAVSDVAVNGGCDVPPSLALRRLGVYHSAYRARLLDTLRDTYGHTLRLLGDEAFDALALAYIAQSPSACRNLRWYGDTWPEFLVDTAADTHSAIGAGDADLTSSHCLDVAELARLDWALREAFDGPDDTVLGLRDLQQLAPEAWSSVRLRPHATARRLSMCHNTLQRWHALDDERPVPAAELLPEPGWVLVWRRDDRPHFRSMTVHEAWAVQQLLAGLPWAALCDGLAQAWPDQDATTLAAHCLRRWVDEGVLAEAVLTA